jgi:hypothetical protein
VERTSRQRAGARGSACQIAARPVAALGVEDRARPLTLGADLTRAWNSPGVRIETRKRIIRLLICEIIVDVAGEKLDLIIHWQGGDHTRLEAKKNKTGRNRWVTDADVADLVQVLARQMPDQAIAAVLTRSGNRPVGATAGHVLASARCEARKELRLTVTANVASAARRRSLRLPRH